MPGLQPRAARERVLSASDPLGQKDSLFYGRADRLTRRRLPDGREVFFAYDSVGNLTSVTPPGRPGHVMSYDSAGRMVGYAPPTAGLPASATSYDYNTAKQVTAIHRPDGITVGFGYDTAGRPSSVSFDRGAITFGYHPSTGNLTTLTAPGGNTLGFSYDGSLPTSVTWSGVINGSTAATYNNNFQVTGQTVNGGNAVSFGYDLDGLLTQSGALGLRRDAQNGRLVADSVGGQKTEYAYDSPGALYGMVSTRGTDTLLVTGYVRDSLGRITRLVEKVQGVTHEALFTYDTAGRLKTVTRDSVLAATYTYDQNGNRLAKVGPGLAEAGSYDDQDRMLSYGAASYTYGANGELRTKVVGTDTTKYTYDALGNLTRVILPDGTDIEYVIDAQNRRIGKKVNGILTTGWLYQGQLTPVAELDGAGNVTARFVYATGINVPDFMVRGDSTYRLIRDHLGSVRLVVNVQSGTVAQRIDYDEFGVETQNTNPGWQPFGYAGGLTEAGTGLVRFGARDYLPEAGRWTAKDPVGFQGGSSSFFVYAGSDPVNLTDPTGLRTFDKCTSARLLNTLVRDLGSNPNDFWPDWPKGYDFKNKDMVSHHSATPQDYYQVEGLDRPLRSDEFGNFAAGYAGYRNFGGIGELGVRLGGLWYAFKNIIGEPDFLDLDSKPMIDLGVETAARERPWSGYGANAGVWQPPTHTVTDPCGCK